MQAPPFIAEPVCPKNSARSVARSMSAWMRNSLVAVGFLSEGFQAGFAAVVLIVGG